MWEILESIDKRLATLRNAVEQAARPRAASGRELLTVLQQEIVCTEDDLQEQRAVFYHGDATTLHVQRLGVTVSVSKLAAPNNRWPLSKVTNGWSSQATAQAPGQFSLTGSNVLFDGSFDFVWNYQTNSRQSFYSREYCMSDMLVGFDRGQMLDFRVPLMLPKGESIEFRVKPLRYAFPGTTGKTAGMRYHIGFVGLGYRSAL